MELYSKYTISFGYCLACDNAKVVIMVLKMMALNLFAPFAITHPRQIECEARHKMKYENVNQTQNGR